jgi:hypothetical protein
MGNTVPSILLSDCVAVLILEFKAAKLGNELESLGIRQEEGGINNDVSIYEERGKKNAVR